MKCENARGRRKVESPAWRTLSAADVGDRILLHILRGFAASRLCAPPLSPFLSGPLEIDKNILVTK